MNIDKLKEYEASFLQLYPLGFADPGMQDIVKKHSKQKLTDKCQSAFSEVEFNKPLQIVDNMTKFISQSSLISLFEKPKFRDFVKTLTNREIKQLSDGLKAFLHGNQQRGFEDMVTVLEPGRLAKWSLLTIIPNYYHPDQEVFVKPTTTKKVIQQLELEGLTYRPAPTWEFYETYRHQILALRDNVSPSLAPSNAAFCGFLMMS